MQSVGTPVVDAPDVTGAIIYDFSTGKWDPVGAATLGSNLSPSVSTYGTVSAAGRVSASRTVAVNIFVSNSSALQDGDYDLGAVGITVSYQVLQ